MSRAENEETQDDRVTLVALHALQVLDEEPLLPVLVEELGQFLGELVVLAQPLAQGFLDPAAVLDAHGDDAQRFIGPALGMVEDQVDDGVHFGRGTVRVGSRDPWHRNEPQNLISAHPGECGQHLVVDVRVGERDQPLVPAPVVPAQHP